MKRMIRIQSHIEVTDDQAELIEEWVEEAYKQGNQDGYEERDLRR